MPSVAPLNPMRSTGMTDFIVISSLFDGSSETTDDSCREMQNPFIRVLSEKRRTLVSIMQWIRAWLESDGIGYHWFAQGMRDAPSASEGQQTQPLQTPFPAPEKDNGSRPLDMELQGWERDINSARIACVQAQTRWFIACGDEVNQYVMPEVKA